MGDEGRGPRPFKQVQTRTTFLRVATVDWAAVCRGSKTEFRSMGGNTSALWLATCPMPVVLYKTGGASYGSSLAVLEETWRERLIDMSADSLHREGFETFDDFRNYWCRRERRRFMPMNEVSVYRVRPWQSGDLDAMGQLLIERMYGDFLPR